MDMDEANLVHGAIISRVTGDCEWDDRAARRVRCDRDLQGLTPEYIRELLRDHVTQHGIGVIDQRPETRSEYSDYRFYYRVIVPVEEFQHGLFVELRLVDDDPDAPAVRIVNAHEQRR